MVVFVMGCVLCGVHLEEAVSLVGVHSGTRYVDVCSLSHVVSRGGDKLGRKMSVSWLMRDSCDAHE